jgi:hypothetical protein
MWKKMAQALGAVSEENENESPTPEGSDRTILEIVSVKGTTETICSVVGWISISFSFNGKVENSQTRHLQPPENCYYENNNWWIFTGLSASTSTFSLTLPVLQQNKF